MVPEGITAFFDFAFNGCPSLTVYYGGTEAQWNNIRFNSYNNSIQSPRKIYYRAMGTTGDVSYLFYDGTLTIYGNGDMADYEAQGAPWFSYYTEITKIVVEDGVTSIGDYAFDRCERASSITLSKDLTSIGEGAFQDCTSVTALTIPAGVTSIDDKAFRYCDDLRTLTFTGNAPTMGDAFYNIPNLTVYYPAGDSSWDSVAGKNYGNQYPVTWIATCGETHDFENGVISYNWASDYSSCTAALTCGNSGCMVSGSGNSKTVKSTSSREEATCSKPGKTVYTAVFSAPYETQTKEVPIPATGEHNYSKEVASAAFRVSAATCQSPAVYKKSCACGAASDTETFTYGEAGEHTRDENHKCTVCGHIGGFCGISSQNNGKDLCWTLKDGVLTISGTGAMGDFNSESEPWYSYRNVITSAVVGEGVTTLGQAAFDECEKLQTVELPSTLTVIGQWAFSGCADLTAIDIPDSVHTIGAAAFGHCDMLTSVTIPAGVTEILGSTFYTCDRLETVTLLGNITTIGDSAFGYCYKLKNFTIPSTVTSIGKYAFRSCWGLTEVTIPAGVKVVNYGTFYDCTNLVSVKLPKGLTKIDESAFDRCGKLAEINLPSTLTTIGPQAFASCKQLESLVLPDSVTGIGKYAFSGCEKLTSVTLSKNLASIPEGAFNLCPITEIEIPASVTSIATKAFGYCRSLTQITFLGNAPTFGADTFKEVTNATALYPRTGTGWAEAVKSTYGGTVTWKMYCPNGQHSFEEIVDEAHLVSEATCAQGAVYKKLCPCGEVSATETFIHGNTNPDHHDMGQWYEYAAPTPEADGEERSDCSRCDHYDSRPLAFRGPVILLEDAELQNQTTVWIDGAPYPVVTDPDRKIVRVPENSNIKEGSALVTYEYYTGTAGDVHTQYPTGMKVWILSQQEDGNFTATRVSEFDNLLQYSGCSIRIVGVKGIRMITSINQSTKKALTGKGLAGFTLVEYGTALCRASALADGQPMTLENSNVKSKYAYKKGVADPVFKYSGNLVQYTNVLVGFTDDDCKEDIAIRPYIILQNESGETVTIYGGIIYRSIGYIAYQNRNAFAVGSDAYEYVWSIIHHVYGDEFDTDYKS